MKQHAVGQNYIRSLTVDDPLRDGELILECDDLELCIVDYPNGIARQMTAQEMADKAVAQMVADAAREQDKADKQAFKAKVVSIKNNIATIVATQQAHIDAPVLTDAGRDAQILQQAKDIQQLAKGLKFVVNAVKGLI
jgi:N12 class adenine-specific DNA methylase